MSKQRIRRRFGGLLVAVLAAAVLTPGAAAKPAQPSPAVGTPAAGPAVTLLTGDQVRLGGPRGALVRPAAGRERVPILVQTDRRGHVLVIPGDAATLVASGRLDPQLFDVTALVAARYDDVSRPDLPLIVDYPGATPRTTAGATVTRELPSISATAVRADRTAAFWPAVRDAQARVWLDAPVRATLDQSVPRIGAPAAWAAGHTGTGTTVAVLDTGIDATHPDLAGAVTGEQDFTGSATGADDDTGHGTHVASTITGAGPKYRGVAPDAALLNGKVLDDNGSGTLSGIIAGMEWAAASGADVINMSLGSDQPSDGTDPLSQAVNELTARTGALFVVASGNEGRRGWTVGSPAAADAALTVGAVDRDDKLAPFSSGGPRSGDAAIKPDLTAPGVGIVAAKAKHGQIGEPVGEAHVALSGTSMATPHVAGAAAILASQHPDWNPEQLKTALMNTAKPTTGHTVFEQGTGRVDVAAAVITRLTAGPGSLSFGLARWPHGDDQPVTKSVTYTNTGTEPVTLDLAADVRGPNETPPPPGMFTTEPSRLTVPAGGQATATITADTTIETPDGMYAGVLTATGGGLALRTPMAVDREVESYDLTLHVLDDVGVPTGEFFLNFAAVDRNWGSNPWDPSGTMTMRLPRGEYNLSGWIERLGPEDSQIATVAEPSIKLTRDTELTLDARRRKHLEFTVDQPTARPGVVTTEHERQTAHGPLRLIAQNWDASRLTVVPSTTAAPTDDFRFSVEARLAKPDGNGQTPDFEGSPYLYGLYWEHRGRVPADLHRTYTDRELATVRSTYAVSMPGVTGVRDEMVTGKAPWALTEHYTPDVPWYSRFYEERDRYDYVTFSDQVRPTVYRRGKTYDKRYNGGVFGPAFPYHESYPNFMMAGRLENHVGLNLPLAAEGDPDRTDFTTSRQLPGRFELLRDGKLIAEAPNPVLFESVELPPDEDTYTMRSTVDRTANGNRLSTTVSSEWTFKSAYVPPNELFRPQPLPLLAVRFAPRLDLDNAAPAGKGFRFPVHVQRGGSPTPIAVTAPPAVEVSYDDGATWRPVRLTRDRDQWLAHVDHPKHAKFVSLRTSVADREGNSAKHTIIRAYALS